MSAIALSSGAFLAHARAPCQPFRVVSRVMADTLKPPTVPFAQYEAAQDCLMKAILGAFTKNPDIINISVEKAVAKNIVALMMKEDSPRLTVVEWPAS